MAIMSLGRILPSKLWSQRRDAMGREKFEMLTEIGREHRFAKDF